jgi:hypothetical protein
VATSSRKKLELTLLTSGGRSVGIVAVGGCSERHYRFGETQNSSATHLRIHFVPHCKHKTSLLHIKNSVPTSLGTHYSFATRITPLTPRRTHEAEWTPFQTHYSFSSSDRESNPGPSDLQPGTLTTRPQRRTNKYSGNLIIEIYFHALKLYYK